MPVHTLRTLIAILFAGLLAGCAATRSTFDLPVAQAPTNAMAPPVKIIAVTDLRQFEAAPRNPSTPSLQSPDDLGNPAITTRAIARKRGGYGNAMGDILLPEGRTVAAVVRDAVSNAVQAKGYAVVPETSPAFAQAQPLKVEIQQFWAWATPGFWQVAVEFQSVLRLKSDALFNEGEDVVRGYSRETGMAITDDVWQQVMQQGLADLTAQLTARLKDPNER